MGHAMELLYQAEITKIQIGPKLLEEGPALSKVFFI
jgi:hypothetical protein